MPDSKSGAASSESSARSIPCSARKALRSSRSDTGYRIESAARAGRAARERSGGLQRLRATARHGLAVDLAARAAWDLVEHIPALRELVLRQVPSAPAL